MRAPSSRTRLPPPRPMASTSGMRKLVRTPPMSTETAASRGKPRMSMPTSDVVPPMSTTIASLRPASSAAPRMELVGPDAKVSTGYFSTCSGTISVPSFWLMKNGASTLSSPSARRNEDTTAKARSTRQAFITVAFSRSRKPMRPISCESESRMPGTSSATMAAARCSISAVTGENTELIAAAVMFFCLSSRATLRTPISSSGAISRPSNSLPPRSM